MLCLLACSFDEECREQVADGLKGRGIHLYPETSPTRWLSSNISHPCLHGKEGHMHFASQLTSSPACEVYVCAEKLCCAPTG